jgi:hypothetical protein
MKIILQTIEFYHGIALVSCPVSSVQLEEIKKHHWFGFQEEIFESPIIPIQHSASLWLIADEEKAAGWKKGDEVDLEFNQWTVYRLEIDKQVSETFLSLRLTGKLPGTLEEAVVAFTLRKSDPEKILSSDNFSSVKNLFSNLFELAAGSNASESNLKTLTNAILSNSIDVAKASDLTSTLEDYFKENNIPAEKHLKGYRFHIVASEDEWNVEIETNEEKEKLQIASYVQIAADPDVLKKIKQDLEVINEEMVTGNFGLIDSPLTIYLNSDVLINAFTSTKDLNLAMTPIYDSMKALILVMKEKYGSQIILIN